MSVSVWLRLSVREYISGTTRPIFTNFLHHACGRGSIQVSGGVAIRYVLPVLRLTSRRQVIARSRRQEKDVYSKRLNGGQHWTGAESDIYDCFVYHSQCVNCVVDTSYILCGIGSVKLPTVRLSVRRIIIRLPHAAAAGLLLWARRRGDIDRLLHDYRCSAGSKCEQRHVVSWTQTC